MTTRTAAAAVDASSGGLPRTSHNEPEITRTETTEPYRYIDTDGFCLSARLLPDLNTGADTGTLSITIEGSDEPQSIHVPGAEASSVTAGILRAAGHPAPVVPSADRAADVQRIAEALCPSHHRQGSMSSTDAAVPALRPCNFHMAEAGNVLAVLPDPAVAPADDTDLSEADIDRLMAEGVPVQIVTAPPDTHGVTARVCSDRIECGHEAALGQARETNRRLNLRAQQLESELTKYRRAVDQWEISDERAYVPLHTVASIAKAAGLEVPDRWEMHSARVERLELEVATVRARALTEAADICETVAEELRKHHEFERSTGALDAMTELRRLAGEQPDTKTEDGFVPPVAAGLPAGTLEAAEIGASRLDAWARTPYGRNVLAHALVQLARVGWLRREPGVGFEPLRDGGDAEAWDVPDARPGTTDHTLTQRPRCPECGLPHDLTPGSMAVRTCEWIRASIAEARRRHAEGDHGGCAAVDCETSRAQLNGDDTAAGVGQDGAENDRVVAYRFRYGRSLRCLAHPPFGLDSGNYEPVTSEDLPDGGTCTFTRHGEACGVDVLIPQQGAGQ